MSRVLIVDDDPGWVDRLAAELGSEHAVSALTDGGAAIQELQRRPFDAIVVDLGMPETTGFDVLRAAQELDLPPFAIVLSGMDSTRATLDALRLGAREYLLKPTDPGEVRRTLARSLARVSVAVSDAALSGLIGSSAKMTKVRKQLGLFAACDGTVLIHGETGCGKELFARGLHRLSPRAAGPFVAHNMAATPGELAESLFFGHVRGAFSGAHGDHAGLFEQASGGTLFLDEVDSFPLPLQAKLLRVLEAQRVQRVGSATDRPVDVRVVAASATDLLRQVESGKFRADLYYRLSQLEASLPPLREHLEDVPEIAEYFLDEIGRETGRRPTVSAAALAALSTHQWPGNCRELRHALRRAAVLAQGAAIAPGHLPQQVRRGTGIAPSPMVRLREREGEHILDVLERVRGNQSKAARILGIDRGTLARRLKGMQVPGR